MLGHTELRATVQVRGSSGTCRVYSDVGKLFVPWGRSAKPSGPSATGRFRRFTSLAASLRKRSDRLTVPATEDPHQRRARARELLHGLFLWTDAEVRVDPGPWPEEVVEQFREGEGFEVEIQSLLMDVARQADEAHRVRRALPSSRILVRTLRGSELEVAAELGAVGVDLDRGPLDGSLPLDELIARWGTARHETLAAIARCVEGGSLTLLPREEARERYFTFLEADNLPDAAQVLGHLRELDAETPARALDLEPAFVRSKRFRLGKPVECDLRLEGPRVLALIRELFAAETPFSLTLLEGERVKSIGLLPGVLTVALDPPTDVPPLEAFLARLAKKPIEEMRDLRRRKGTFQGLISAPLLEQAVLEKLVEELAEVALWGEAQVHLSNRGQRRQAQTPEGDALILSLTKGVLGHVRQGLEEWAEVFREVPSEDAVFVAGPSCKRGDPGAAFFARFGPARNVGEMRRLTKSPRLAFAKVLRQGLTGRYLVRPSAKVLTAWIHNLRERDDHLLAYRLLRAALAFGYDRDVAEWRDEYRGRDLLPHPESSLRGDLAAIGGLPSIMQLLSDGRHTGTLRIRAPGHDPEEVYFDRGGLFVLHREDQADAEFLELILGSEGTEQVEGLRAVQELEEGELDPALVRSLKDRFLEVIMWTDATFEFGAHDLPEDAFAPNLGATKVTLRTQEFLLEAARSMSEWDHVRQFLPNDDAVLRFPAGDHKLEAIRAFDEFSDALMLIDGRLSFAELVRRTGETRLAVGKVVASLIEAGSLQVATYA